MKQTGAAHVKDMEIPVSRGYWQTVWQRLLCDRMTLACGLVLVGIVMVAVLAPLLAPADPYKTSMLKRLLPVGTKGFLLGTDELGRDMISRLIYGARLTLIMGIIPVIIALIIGATLGMIAGYAGGRTNMLIMRITDVFYAFPSVLLAIAISGALGGGILNAMISLTIVFTAPLTRVAESVTTQVRGYDFVDAARATGADPFTIIRVHILGNVLSPIFVYATSLISVSMILASGLSFLGLGAKPPSPEWGLMLNTLRTAIYNNPLVAVLPGFMIFIVSICFNLMSDGLRSAMDVTD